VPTYTIPPSSVATTAAKRPGWPTNASIRSVTSMSFWKPTAPAHAASCVADTLPRSTAA
jgi:hypothetical protein